MYECGVVLIEGFGPPPLSEVISGTVELAGFRLTLCYAF